MYCTMIPTILLQASPVGSALKALLETLSTPAGLIGGTLGIVVLAAVVLRREGAFLGGALVLILMTMMEQENRYFDNTLIGPLQKLRDVARIGSVALLVALTINLTLAPSNSRKRRLSFAMIAFLLFETYYLGRLALHGEATRAAFGWLTDLLVFASFGLGFGKKLDTSKDFERFVGMFGVASLVFIAFNVIQLVLGYSFAIAGGRFAGISGNAQLAGYVCAVFILFNTHIYSSSSFGSYKRYLYAIAIGFLAVFLLWSGSRTSALCCVAGLLVYFRLRIGTLAVLAALAGIVLTVVAALFTESLGGVDRFLQGENTRRQIWMQLLDEFYSAPLFGAMSGRAGIVSASESSYLTTLALLGIVGAIPLALLVGGIFSPGVRALFARRSGLVPPLQADLILGSIPVIIIGSIFEGFFLGILAFSVIWIYAFMALAAYVVERASEPPPSDEDDEAYLVVETESESDDDDGRSYNEAVSTDSDTQRM